MVKQNNQLPLVILAILLLVAVSQIQVGNFILYGGVEISANLTNITKSCFTIMGTGEDIRCVKQEVNMLMLESGLLICPELHYATLIDCERAFGLIKEPAKPKLDCYYVKDDVCVLEQFEDQCPVAYYISLEACQTSLIDFGYSAKKLFSERKTLILLGIGGIALLFMLLNFLRRR